MSCISQHQRKTWTVFHNTHDAGKLITNMYLIY